MSEEAPAPKPSAMAKLASIGASAQAAIPGLYAWAITVAPAAWSRGGPLLAKIASIVGVIALTTAPLVEGAAFRATPPSPSAEPPRGLAAVKTWTGATWARIWSVWGFVLSSAIVWALVPGALSSARVDAIRGALGMVGWALFAFASAGPSLRPNPDSTGRVVAGPTLKPRSDLPRGDGVYVLAGCVLAVAMQVVGWGIAVPERAVLVRLVTVVCGVAVLGATTQIALARHAARVPAGASLRFKRALPWLVLLVMCMVSGAAMSAGAVR